MAGELRVGVGIDSWWNHGGPYACFFSRVLCLSRRIEDGRHVLESAKSFFGRSPSGLHKQSSKIGLNAVFLSPMIHDSWGLQPIPFPFTARRRGQKVSTHFSRLWTVVGTFPPLRTLKSDARQALARIYHRIEWKGFTLLLGAYMLDNPISSTALLT